MNLKKLVKKREVALSFVIGVILMVFVTSIIAAAVGLYAAGNMGVSINRPEAVFQRSEEIYPTQGSEEGYTKNLIFIGADRELFWEDIEFRKDGVLIEEHGMNGVVKVGDALEISEIAGTDEYTLSIIHTPTSTLLAVFKFIDAIPYPSIGPTANDDSYSVNAGDTLTVPAPGVLGNDVPFGTLTASLVSGPICSSGFTFNSDGSFDYTHDGSETVSDSFVYEVEDGGGGTNQATVTITVTPQDDQPIANDDSYTVIRGESLNIGAPGVLGNDVPFGTLTASLVSGPICSSGFTFNSDGSFDYTHDGSETVSDSFVYEVEDGGGGTNQATVTITVTEPPCGGWIKTYDYQNDVLFDLEVTDDGFVMVGLEGNGKDSLVIKTNGDGDVDWAKIYGGAGVDNVKHGYSILPLNGGSGYILHTGGEWGPLCNLIKTGSNGDIGWAKGYRLPAWTQTGFDGIIEVSLNNDAWGNKVIEANDGGYIMFGEIEYTNSYNDDVSTHTDFFAMKTNADGQVEWIKSYGEQWSNTDDIGKSISSTPAVGGYIMAGYSDSFSGDGENDFLLIKIHENGVVDWVKSYSFGGISYDSEDFGMSVLPTSDNGYIISGTMDTYKKIVAIKTNPNGDVGTTGTWAMSYERDDGNTFEYESGVIQPSGSDGYGIVGYLDFDKMLMEIDAADGALQWAKTYEDAPGTTFEYGVDTRHIESGDGGYIVGGQAWRTRGYDFILARTDSNGEIGTCDTNRNITGYDITDDIDDYDIPINLSSNPPDDTLSVFDLSSYLMDDFSVTVTVTEASIDVETICSDC